MASFDSSKLSFHPDYIIYDSKHIIYMPPELQEILMQNNQCINQLSHVISEYTRVNGSHDGLCIVGLPDMHLGYSFPIGTVVGIADSKYIAPMGVGYDINCGVRVLKTNLQYDHVIGNLSLIMDDLHRLVPSGTRKSNLDINSSQMKRILKHGICAMLGDKYKIKDGNGSVGPLYESIDQYEPVESNGGVECDISKINQKLVGKGVSMFGTLGSGNHYLEIDRVVEVYDDSIGLVVDQIVVMIHCGSRGLGHEVCRVYSESNGLFVPMDTQDGMDYYNLMNCAANYAYANREIISGMVNHVVQKYNSGASIETLCDSGHNLARKEIVDGKEYLVHRKGASRATPGSLVGIGGSMATNSYIVSTGTNAQSTFFSTAHGSGRIMRRKDANLQISYDSVIKTMEGIEMRTDTKQGVVEEAGCCYKDVNVVVEHCEKMGKSHRVAKIKPIGVIKG